MDVVRLGPRYSTDYIPDKKIEGYSSMIFAERWQTPGDFELTTPKIAETLELLPLDTLISHLESDDVHIVEDHEIEQDEFGRPELKVKGKSLTHFTNHRYVQARYNKKRKMARKYSNSAVLGVLLYQAFDNPSGKDVTRDGDFDWNTLDVIPNIAITESVGDLSANRNRWLINGSLGPQIQELLTKTDLSIRMIRPSRGSTGTIVKVKAWPLDERGMIVRTNTDNIMALRFDIYEGVNRVSTVKFKVQSGDIDKPQYLFSRADYKTAIELMSDVYIPDEYRNANEKLYKGLRRRVGTLDMGQADLPDEPKRPRDPRKNATKAEKEQWREDVDKWRDKHDTWETKYKNELAEFRDDAEMDGKRMLKSTRQVSMISGDISPLAPYKFGVDYNLGDRVSLVGEYDKTETPMIVTEYIRTENQDGDHGYPGLTSPDA